VAKLEVKVGQAWKDNDPRLARRVFEVLEIDMSYYPKGRAKCKLLSSMEKGQREIFYCRLDRFNGTKRGYSMVSEAGARAVAKKTKKKTKKKAGKARKKKP